MGRTPASRAHLTSGDRDREFGGNDGLRGLPVSPPKPLATMIEAFRSRRKGRAAGMTLPELWAEYIHPFEQMYVDLAKQFKVT